MVRRRGWQGRVERAVRDHGLGTRGVGQLAGLWVKVFTAAGIQPSGRECVVVRVNIHTQRFRPARSATSARVHWRDAARMHACAATPQHARQRRR